MSAPETKIRAAFVTRLQLFPSLPPVAWENVAFTPGSVPYLSPFLLPAEPFQSEIGTAGANRHTGIFQISIFAPQGQGMGVAGTLRDNLVDHFKRGTTLTYSGVTVTVEKAYPGPMLTEVGWVHIPITIRYRADAAN